MQNTVFGYKKGSKIESNKIFWSATPKLWVVSFAIFDSWSFYQTKSWKTEITVFGYKKGSKIESDKIFWSATPKLWVVSFAIFDSWSFYQAKSWKTEITVFAHKKGSKIESDKIFWSATPKLWVVSFATLNLSHDHFIKPKAQERKIPFLVTKRSQKINLTRFSDWRTPNCGWFHLLLFLESGRFIPCKGGVGQGILVRISPPPSTK